MRVLPRIGSPGGGPRPPSGAPFTGAPLGAPAPTASGGRPVGMSDTEPDAAARSLAAGTPRPVGTTDTDPAPGPVHDPPPAGGAPARSKPVGTTETESAPAGALRPPAPKDPDESGAAPPAGASAPGSVGIL